MPRSRRRARCGSDGGARDAGATRAGRPRVLATWAIGLAAGMPGATLAEARASRKRLTWSFSRAGPVPYRDRRFYRRSGREPQRIAAGRRSASAGTPATSNWRSGFVSTGKRRPAASSSPALASTTPRTSCAGGTGETRVTVGTQNLAWGRTDEVPPVDRLSRADISRGPLDPLPERRRAVPAVRVEHFVGELKLDAAWLPVFDPAVLPDPHSVWNPVDTVHGRILGIGAVPLHHRCARSKRAGMEAYQRGGLRVTRTGTGVDWGVSRPARPPVAALLPRRFRRLTEVHPLAWVLGGELEAEAAGATWRIEGAWTGDVPVTAAPLSRYRTAPAWDVVAGVEAFARDGDTRLTLQLAGHRTQVDVAVYDRTEYLRRAGRDRAPLRSQPLARQPALLRGYRPERDVYVNPRLAYTGFDGHEFYLAGHWFAGGPKTLGGYYDANDLIALGWQTRF